MRAGARTEPKDGREGGFLASTAGVVTLALVATFLWGSAFPCIKIGYRLFSIPADDTASQMLFAGARFVLAGLGVIGAMSLVRRRPLVARREDARCVLVLSLFQTTLQYALFYLGLGHASGVTSSIIEATNTFFCILIAALVFKLERLTARKLAGCAVGFAGVALVTLSQGSGGLSFSLAGEGAVLASTLAAATSSSLIQVFSHEGHDPVTLSGWQFLVGGLTLSAIGLAGGGSLSPSGPASVALLLYLAFISAAAYSLWSLLLANNPVSRVSVFGFCNPVFGAILSTLLLDEGGIVSPAVLLCSLALASAGIVIVNTRRPARRTRAAR
ncbi:MAG: DMT family transporter [Atopobiaceae bacterium]|nr:DMT family transporter [Olsenella sp.]MDY3901480.1 DMT family transporter [Atopobiaceae bacterium]